MAFGLTSLLASTLVSFVIAAAFLFIRYFQHKYDRNQITTATSVLGLVIALLTCALIPTDIFLTSFMKNSDGTFKNWANNTEIREFVENSVLYSYYIFYSCLLVFLFIVIPLVYFYCEENDEDTSCGMKFCTCFKYSSFFLIMMVVFFIIGAFVPFKTKLPQNSTDLTYLSNELDSHAISHVENAVSFVISLLSLFGMFTLVLYMGAGTGLYPVDLIKGRRGINREYSDLLNRRLIICGQIKELKHKAASVQLTSGELDHLETLEDEEQLVNRRLQHLGMAQTDLLRKCLLLLRPLQIMFGVIFILLVFLIMISLMITNIDRFMNSLGPKVGYLLPKNNLPIIMDVIFVFAQKVFPLDYILVFAVVCFLITCSVGGMSSIGIWLLWIRIYKIRAHKTKPQALLMASFLLMYIALAINILLHQMAPQYVTYGSQNYRIYHEMSVNGAIGPGIIPCNVDAPPGECIMTQTAKLLFRFYFRLWFFGAAYYWLSWIFIFVFAVSFIVAIVKKKRSTIEGQVEYDDLYDEEEPLLGNA